jgi:hypothetical protein
VKLYIFRPSGNSSQRDENKEEGFYNFIENYENIYFLTRLFSEFLQVGNYMFVYITV